jgi:GxxExxY protein
MDELLYKDITFDIRGACFWVWKEFRGAFKETVVDRALTIELRKRGRVVEDQKVINIYYEGQKVGEYRPDKIVDEKVLVELKSKEYITEQDMDQFWKYLKGSKYKVGLLINFGPKNLEIKRLVYDSARQNGSPRLDLRNRSALNSAEKGFTLMEIVVSTTIFVIVFTAMLALFNYTLKINRRSEALRQASQGMRNMVEFLVKEIRNGQIDYGLIDPGGQFSSSPPTPCPKPVAGSDSYQSKENMLGVVSIDGTEECFYYGKADGSYAGAGVFSSSTGASTLVFNKGNLGLQILNPPNFKVDNLMFLVRPVKDPYTSTGGLAKFSPVVSMFIKFTTKLPTGEQVPIYYQTSVATNQYDVPNQ